MNKLEFEFDGRTELWRCYDPKMNWIAFSGFGETKEKAKLNFFLNQPKGKKPLRN